MKLFLVSYDLATPGQDWSVLIVRLQQLGAVRILASVWLVESSLSHSQLRDDLLTYIDTNDRLFVGEMTRNAAWRRLMISNEAAVSYIQR